MTRGGRHRHSEWSSDGSECGVQSSQSVVLVRAFPDSHDTQWSVMLLSR